MFNSIRLFEFVPTQRAWTLCGTVGEGIVPKAHLDFVRDAATSQTRLVVIEEDSGASLTDHIVTADARLEPSVSGEQAWVFLVHNDAVPSPIPSHLREGSSGDRVFAVHFASASDAARFAKQHRAACLLAGMSGSPAAAPDAGRAVTCSIGAGATHGCEVPTAVLQAVEGSAWLAERSANQDAFAIGNGVTLGRSAVFAIFDGHGPHGARVAESLQRRIVGDVRSTCSEEEADERVSAALRALVEAAQQRLEHEFGSALAESGCSALIVVATGATLTVAHTGGCQLLLVAGGRGTADALRYSSYSSTPSATALTASHSPAHPSERRRIEAAGPLRSRLYRYMHYMLCKLVSQVDLLPLASLIPRRRRRCFEHRSAAHCGAPDLRGAAQRKQCRAQRRERPRVVSAQHWTRPPPLPLHWRSDCPSAVRGRGNA